MTAQEKKRIAELRSVGFGYKKIAAEIGISENTVKSYLKRMIDTDDQKKPNQPAAVFSCLQCGKPVPQNPGRKEKKFCSDACRYRWWNSHPAKDADRICPVCGERFTAYGRRSRKYCSHACYILDRFGGAACD